MQVISGRHVQAAIAARVLGPESTPKRLGDITLHAHQREGADRALHLLRAFGGALIADDVGLGKTYLALAVAHAFQHPLILTPAALGATWADAARRAGADATIRSFESLARCGVSSVHDIVIADEAHHLRNPTTKRFECVRGLCATTPVLLLSATPVQNRLDDLRVIMSLFLGERAHALSADELAAMIMRRDARSVTLPGANLPTSAPPVWLHPRGDVDCLERLLALPPPIPPSDASDGGALLAYTLVRQWASSRAALVGALRRRVARAHAIEDSLAGGRMPRRRDLAAWCFAETEQQTAFAFMAAGPCTPNAAQLLRQVSDHRLATRATIDWLASVPNPDESRADLLRDVVARHPGRRIVAFTEYAETAEALFRFLYPQTRVAMLTHAGGRVAAGRLTRAEILALFAPGSRRTTPERERIDLLLTTDVLSEGVSLHDASVVVHLDLPWNPARLAQRVGRVRRLGSPESSVIVYATAPPAPAERMLDLEARLTHKLATASSAVGASGDVLPGLAPTNGDSAADLHQELASALNSWRRAGSPPVDAVCGAVRSTLRGFVACVHLNGHVRIIGGTSAVGDEPTALADLVRCASDVEADVDESAFASAETLIAAWLKRHSTIDVVDLPERRVARSRRALLQRVEYVSSRIPRHARAETSPLLAAARAVAVAPLSAGAEQVLDELTHSSLSDTAWLRAVGEFATRHARPSSRANEILALLVLTPFSD